MSVREKIRFLAFHDGEADWEGLFGEELTGWSAKFCVHLHGDQTGYVGTVRGTCDGQEDLEWDAAPGVPPGDERFVSNLERFVITAFRTCIGVRFVMEAVSLDDVESGYLEEEEEVRT